MRWFSLKGILAQRRAVNSVAVKAFPLTEEEIKEGRKIDYVCAHYTVMGLSFIIKRKNGEILQQRVPGCTPQAIAEMFLTLGE